MKKEQRHFDVTHRYTIVLYLLSRWWVTFSSYLFYTEYITCVPFWGEAFEGEKPTFLSSYFDRNCQSYWISIISFMLNKEYCLIAINSTEDNWNKTKHVHASGFFKNESPWKVRSQWTDFLLFLPVFFLPPLPLPFLFPFNFFFLSISSFLVSFYSSFLLFPSCLLVTIPCGASVDVLEPWKKNQENVEVGRGRDSSGMMLSCWSSC